MITGYAELVRTQAFEGLKGVFVGFAPLDAPRPCLVLRRSGGDRNDALDENDDSLIFTDVDHQVVASADTMEDAVAIAGLITDYLEDADDVPMGERVLAAATVDEPEDLANPPQDGSDNWLVGTQFTAHLQHQG